MQNVIGSKAAEMPFAEKDIHEAWQSIEHYLLEELAPKHLLTFFERERLLSAAEYEIMRPLKRSAVVKKLLLMIREKIPCAFLCLCRALYETKQELIVHGLEEKIKDSHSALPVTPNQEATGMPYSLRVELLKNGKQLDKIESEIGSQFDKGLIVFEHDLTSQCLQFVSGSVIIYLKPLSKHAKETLPFFCQHGGMKNFVLDLLKKKDIFSSLPEGEICINIQVAFDKSSISEDTGEQCREVSQMVDQHSPSLEDSFEMTNDPQLIKQNLLVQFGNITEEIEPLQFQDFFVNKGVLDMHVFDEIRMIKRRKDRAAHFLKQVLDSGDTALALLVEVLKNSGNDDLAKCLCSVRKSSSENIDEGQVADSLIEVVKEDSTTHGRQDDMVWSCSLTIVVKKDEDAGEVQAVVKVPEPE